MKVLVETSVERYITAQTENIKPQIGIVIGQIIDENIYIIYLAKTPENLESNDTPRKLSNKRQSQTLNATEHCNFIVDNAWVWQHAKQANNMLPGGLEIIGLYTLNPTSNANVLLNPQQTLQGLEKNIRNFEIIPQKAQSNIYCLVTVHKDLKPSINAYKISEPNQMTLVAESVNFQYETFTNNWIRLDSKVVFDWFYIIQKSSFVSSPFRGYLSSNIALRNQLNQGLMPYLKSLKPDVSNQNICYLINGKLYNDEADLSKLIATLSPNNCGLNEKINDLDDKNCTLQQGSSKKNLNKKKNNSNPPQAMGTANNQTRLLVDIIKILPVTEEKSPNEHGSHLFTMNGSLAARAYVPPTFTIKQALEALVKDIRRSLSARCEIIVDEEDTYEHERESATLFETPSRVFVPLAGTQLTICDYIFRGEESSECLEPLKELLDLHVDPGQIESDVEKFSDPSEISVTPLASTTTLFSNKGVLSSCVLPSRITFSKILTFAIPLIFMLLAYAVKFLGFFSPPKQEK